MVGGKFYSILLILLAQSVLNSTIALAYLDPGTGSMILQFLIGGLAAAAIVLKTRWYKIRAYFSKIKTK
jgi:hypothetical protein